MYFCASSLLSRCWRNTDGACVSWLSLTWKQVGLGFLSYVEKQLFQLLFYSSSSQLIKLSHLWRSFCSREILSGPKKTTFVSVEGQDQMEAEIVVMAKFLVVVLTVCCPAKQVAKFLRKRVESKETKCVTSSTASHYFTFGCASPGNSSSFKPVAITTTKSSVQCQWKWKLLISNCLSPPHFV